MTKLLFRYISPILPFCLLLSHAFSQDSKQLLAELVAAEEEAIQALVLYPEETRLAILEATLYPEVLIKIERIQSQTRASLQAALERYPQQTQALIWDLTRYPGLIGQLVTAGPSLSKDAWKTLINGYPEVIHKRAKEAYTNYFVDLETLHDLQVQADEAFEILLASYPTNTQSALRQLMPLPEVLSILTENIRLAVLAGALYRQEPDWLLQQVDSLHLAVARQNAQELEDWKVSLEADPTAQEELLASAEAFSTEYAYDDEYYDYAQDDLYYEEPSRDRVAHDYYFYHYPYWFGYPHWYYYPRWRLYPYWYDWGFYYGANRSIVVISLPSFYYTHWYFHYPNHHYRWSRLSAHFTRHQRAHPRMGSSISTGVSVWQHRNRDVISRTWLEDDGNLADRFREFGKFESQRTQYNQNHPRTPLSQAQYITRNSRRYPQMAKKVATRSTSTTIIRPPKTSATKDLSKPRKTNTRILPSKKKSEVQKRKKTTPTRTYSPSRIKEGTERHRSLSERSKAARTPRAQPAKPRVPTKTRTIKPKPKTKGQRVPAKRKNG